MTTTRLSNLDLKEDVLEALAFNPRVDSSAIAIKVEDGVVTLSGTLRSLAEIWEAVETVKPIQGVRGIANDLVMEFPGLHHRTDSDIALDIEHRFASDIYIPDTIKFIVRSAEVTLTGSARTYYEREEAVAVARRVRGVRSISDLVSINSAVRVDPDEVTRRIHSHFSQSASHDADNVRVSVHDGHVMLSGTVKTMYERDRAVLAAWNTPGVTSIDDRLTVGY